jgi:hypothetical protein
MSPQWTCVDEEALHDQLHRGSLKSQRVGDHTVTYPADSLLALTSAPGMTLPWVWGAMSAVSRPPALPPHLPLHLLPGPLFMGTLGFFTGLRWMG